MQTSKLDHRKYQTGREWSNNDEAANLGGPGYTLLEARVLLVGADLDGLHPGLRFGARFIDGTSGRHDGLRCHRRLLINDRALLRRGVLHDVELSRLGKGRGGKRRSENGSSKQLMHCTFLSKVKWMGNAAT